MKQLPFLLILFFKIIKKAHRCCFSEGWKKPLQAFWVASPLLLHFFSSSVGVDLHSVIANNQQVFPHIGVILFNKTVGVFSCEHDKVLSFLLFLSAIAWILCQRISIVESTMGYFANHGAIHSRDLWPFPNLIHWFWWFASKNPPGLFCQKTPSLSCAGQLFLTQPKEAVLAVFPPPQPAPSGASPWNRPLPCVWPAVHWRWRWQLALMQWRFAHI